MRALIERAARSLAKSKLAAIVISYAHPPRAHKRQKRQKRSNSAPGQVEQQSILNKLWQFFYRSEPPSPPSPPISPQQTHNSSKRREADITPYSFELISSFLDLFMAEERKARYPISWLQLFFQFCHFEALFDSRYVNSISQECLGGKASQKERERERERESIAASKLTGNFFNTILVLRKTGI